MVGAQDLKRGLAEEGWRWQETNMGDLDMEGCCDAPQLEGL